MEIRQTITITKHQLIAMLQREGIVVGHSAELSLRQTKGVHRLVVSWPANETASPAMKEAK